MMSNIHEKCEANLGFLAQFEKCQKSDSSYWLWLGCKDRYALAKLTHKLHCDTNAIDPITVNLQKIFEKFKFYSHQSQ